MIYLAPGSSIQIYVTPLPAGVPTVLAQVEWISSDNAVVTVAPAAADPTGRTATLTAPKTAKPEAAADVKWRYKNTNGEAASSTTLTVRIAQPQPIEQKITGGTLAVVGEATPVVDEAKEPQPDTSQDKAV